jgi:hypothetical protein
MPQCLFIYLLTISFAKIQPFRFRPNATNSRTISEQIKRKGYMETRSRGPVTDADLSIFLNDLRKTMQIPNSGQSVFGPKFETRTSRFINRNTYHSIATFNMRCAVRQCVYLAFERYMIRISARKQNTVEFSQASVQYLQANTWRPTIQMFLMYIFSRFV